MDAAAVARRRARRRGIVHVAGLAGDLGFPAADTLSVNIAGTANVLVAAEAEGVGRVVHVSSGRALGMLERDPDYLPLDDDHRGLPAQPYALSKWLSEEMCAAFSHRTHVETLCLRPVAVFEAKDYERALHKPSGPPAPGKYWPLGVHIDVRDVAAAAAAAVRCPAPKHVRLLLCADDIAGDTPTLDLVKAYVPHVPWRGGSDYARDPYRALVDTSRARAILGWAPRYKWPTRRSA